MTGFRTTVGENSRSLIARRTLCCLRIRAKSLPSHCSPCLARISVSARSPESHCQPASNDAFGRSWSVKARSTATGTPCRSSTMVWSPEMSTIAHRAMRAPGASPTHPADDLGGERATHARVPQLADAIGLVDLPKLPVGKRNRQIARHGDEQRAACIGIEAGEQDGVGDTLVGIPAEPEQQDIST